MAQKPMLRAEVYAHAMRASQNLKKEVRVGDSATMQYFTAPITGVYFFQISYFCPEGGLDLVTNRQGAI